MKSHRLLSLGLILVILWAGIVLGVAPAMAAEILSVRGANVLQIGDQNRSYGIQLACLKVPDSSQRDALAWLQKKATRGTKVNLRPISQQDGRLVAQVSILKTGMDLGAAMVAEGLAVQHPCSDGAPSS